MNSSTACPRGDDALGACPDAGAGDDGLERHQSGTDLPSPGAAATEGSSRDLDAESAAWAARARELADHALTLFLRRGMLGRHTRRWDDKKLQEVPGRTTSYETVNAQRLTIHFASDDPTDRVGLHVTAEDETGLLAIVDVDAHDGQDTDPAANFAFARAIYHEAMRLGLTARLIDSDGKGGFHIWVHLGRRLPMHECWRLGKFLVRDHARYGFSRAPESFPKSPRLTGKRCGHWVRLWGGHHKGRHFSRIWAEAEGRWLVGHEAIDRILTFGPLAAAIDLASIVPADFHPIPPVAGGQELPERLFAVRSAPGSYVQRRTVRLADEAVWHLIDGEADDYNFWVWVGMCLRELEADGERIWHSWSQRSRKYRAEEAEE